MNIEKQHDIKPRDNVKINKTQKRIFDTECAYCGALRRLYRTFWEADAVACECGCTLTDAQDDYMTASYERAGL